MKKIISLVLIVIFVASGVTAFAGSYDRQASIKGEVKILNWLGFSVSSEDENSIVYRSDRAGESISFQYIPNYFDKEVKDVKDVKEILDAYIDSLYSKEALEKSLTQTYESETLVTINGSERDYAYLNDDILGYVDQINYTKNVVGKNTSNNTKNNICMLFARGTNLYVLNYSGLAVTSANPNYVIYYAEYLSFVEPALPTDAIKIMVNGAYVTPDSDPVIIDARALWSLYKV